LADKECLEILGLGVKAWNIWYNVRNRRLADLRGASLVCADLAGICLTGADMRNADLRYADLHGADLRGADLTGVSLVRANLRAARFDAAKGLTAQQLHVADGDAATQLPKGVERPIHWCQYASAESPSSEQYPCGSANC